MLSSDQSNPPSFGNGNGNTEQEGLINVSALNGNGNGDSTSFTEQPCPARTAACCALPEGGARQQGEGRPAGRPSRLREGTGSRARPFLMSLLSM